MKKKVTTIFFITTALATSILTKAGPVVRAREEKSSRSRSLSWQQLEASGSWTPHKTGLVFSPTVEILSFDSSNSQAEFRLFVPSSSCYLVAFTNYGVFYYSYPSPSRLACSQGIITRINSSGQVLFIDPYSGKYRY